MAVEIVEHIRTNPLLQAVRIRAPHREGELSLRAVVFPESGRWIAQGLEVNFVGCGETVEALLIDFPRQIAAQIEVDEEDGRLAFGDFKPAPKRYWRLFDEAAGKGAVA